MKQQLLSVMVCIRTTSKLRAKVYRQARRYGKPAAVLRDLLVAFSEGRVSIRPDPKKPTLEAPHNVD